MIKLSGRVQEVFGDDAAFWRFTAVVFGCFAAIKGLREPGDWALTQAQLDYSQGFIKRGLLGTMLHGLGIHRHGSLSVAAFVVLFAFLAMLVVLTWRSGLGRAPADARVIALFSSSFAVTYLVHLVGYTDIANALLATCLLLVTRARARFFWALPVFAVGSAIHENFLFFCAPVVLLTFAVQGAVLDGRERRRVWGYGVVLGLWACAFALLTSLHASLDPARASALQRTMAAESDFPLRPDFFAVLTSSLAHNFETMRGPLSSNLWQGWQLLSIFVLGPPLFLLVRFSLRLVREAGFHGRAGSVVRLVAMGAIVAPLLVHFLGWDALRWNVLCVLASFLVLLTLRLYLPSAVLLLSNAEKNAVVFVVAINLASGWGLFDGHAVVPYPYFPKVLNWLWVARHPGQPFVGV